MEIKDKHQILVALQKATTDTVQYCQQITDEIFFYQPSDKWSIAQNVEHLSTSTKMTTLAFSLPKFIVRLYGGKPNRLPRSYDELVTKYKLKLQNGGRATGVFIPKAVAASKGKDKVIKRFADKMCSLSKNIEKNWTDELLDKYIIPHPLLGKITLRELCYFTIYHTYHHLEIISQRIKPG